MQRYRVVGLSTLKQFIGFSKDCSSFDKFLTLFSAKLLESEVPKEAAAMIQTPVSKPTPGEHAKALPTFARHMTFTFLAVLIFVGPASGQLFNAHSPWLREWVMFSGVGAGIPDGRFVVQHEDGSQAEYTPLQAAGLAQYPLTSHYLFDDRIFAPEHFANFAAPLCADLADTSVLGFDGAVGTLQGWKPTKIDDICNLGKVEKS